jgi:hypothetical protein
LVDNALLVFRELYLDPEPTYPKSDWVFAVAGYFSVLGEFGLDFSFKGGEVFDNVFGEDFVGYNDMAHDLAPLMVR